MKPAIILCLIAFQPVFAQQGDYSFGARSTGMGGASTALADPYSSFNNAGGAAVCRQSTLVFSIRNLYSMEGMFAIGAAWNRQFRRGKLLVTLYRFGDDLFSDQKLGVGYSHRIRFISLGLKVSYFQQRIETSGTSTTILIEAGGMVLLGEHLRIGAFILNPNRASLGKVSPEPVPVVLKAGLAWLPGEGITFSLDIRKVIGDADDRPGVAVGLEYILRDIIPVRAGAVFNPAKFSAGTGLSLKKFRIDYGGIVDPFLGLSHEISVIYQFPERQEK